MSSWILSLAVLAGAAYAALSHALMVHATAEPWTVAAVMGPLVAATAALAWRRRHWALLAGVLLAAVALALMAVRGGVQTMNVVYLLQHVGIHVMLGVSFGLSLSQPRSLIARVAERLHPLTPAIVIYTRRVTQAWTLYFFGMASVSVAVYAYVGWPAWSLLANVGTPLVIAALFISEYLLRYRLHPELHRIGLGETVRAWRSGSGARSPAP